MALAIAVLLAGCGGSATSANLAPVASSESAAATPSPATAVGASQTTDAGGHFAFKTPTIQVSGTVFTDRAVRAVVRLYTVPSSGGAKYRLEATLADGTVMLADAHLALADEQAASGVGDDALPTEGDMPWVWLTPVSTLYTVYADAHPTATVGAPALLAVKRYLGLRDHDSVNRPFTVNVASVYSPLAFMRAASGAGLVAFSRSLVPAIDAGARRYFVEADSYVARLPLPQKGAKTARLLGPLGPLVAAVIPGARAWSFTKWLSGGVFTNLVSDIAWKAIGMWAGKLNSGNVTNTLLSNISAQITTLQGQITSLGNFDGTDALAGSLVTDLRNLDAYTFSESNATSYALAPPTPPQAPNYTYNPVGLGGAPNDLTQSAYASLLNQLDAGTANLYAHDILDRLLDMQGESTFGLGNLYTGYAQLQAQKYGSGMTGYSAYPKYNQAFYYDFRNDALVTTPYLQACMAYYGNYLFEAVNMLLESEGRVIGDFNIPKGDGTFLPAGNPAGFLNQGRSLLNGYLANVSAAPQTSPSPPQWAPPPALPIPTPGATPRPAASPTPLPNPGQPQYQNGATYPQVVGGTAYQNGIFALMNRAGQQQPLALLNDSAPLSNVWVAPYDAEDVGGYADANCHLNGTMWAALPGAVFTKSGDDTGYAVSGVSSFTTNNWYGWYIPSNAEVVALFARAQQIGSLAGVTRANQIAYGLLQMGLIDSDAYNHAKNDSGIVEVYDDFSISGSTPTPTLWVYRSDNQKNYDNGLYTKSDFKYQDGHLAVALVVRPFPGRPQGSGTLSLLSCSPKSTPGKDGLANLEAGPPAVLNSATAQSLRTLTGGGLYTWNTDLALAANFIPDEIVVSPDAANPQQMRAYGLWKVGQANAPSTYTTPSHFEGSSFCPYPPVASPYYLIYTELTNSVEWLSSDTSSIEVANQAPTALTVLGGAMTGVSSTAGTAMIENPVFGSHGALTGGTLISLEAAAGSMSGGTTVQGQAFNGSIVGDPQTSASPAPAVPATISSASLSGGTLSGGATFVLSAPTAPDTPLETLVMNATLTNGKVEDTAGHTMVTTVPTSGGQPGLLTVHGNPRAVSITASWMFSPSASTATNNPTASTAAYIPRDSTSYTVGKTTYTLTPVEKPWPIAPGTFPPVTGINSLIISPNNTHLQLTGGGRWLQPFYLTALENDGTYADATAAATWEIFIATPSGAALPTTVGASMGFLTTPGDQGTLDIEPGFHYNGVLVVKATYGGKSTFSVLSVNSFLQ